MAQQGDNFKTRLFAAHALLRLRLGRPVKQDEFRALIGGIIGGDPPAQSTVSRWFAGTVPDVETVRAVARLCQVDPGWLAFGAESEAPAPPGYVAPAEPLKRAGVMSPEDAAKLDAGPRAEAIRAAKAAPARKVGNHRRGT